MKPHLLSVLFNNSNLTRQKLLQDQAMRICKKDTVEIAQHWDRFAVVTYESLASSCFSDRKKKDNKSVLSIVTRR